MKAPFGGRTSSEPDAVSPGFAGCPDDFLTGDISRAIGAEIAAVEEATAVLRAVAAGAAAVEAEAASERIQEAAAADALADQATDEAVTEDLALIGAADEVAAEATKEAQARTQAASITRSEAQILRYLPQPVPFSVIADKLGISRSAAKERAERLLRR
jgi:DNA-binding NarL/FixJ family response regulator